MSYFFTYGDFVETVNGDVGYLIFTNGKTVYNTTDDEDEFISFAASIYPQNKVTCCYNGTLKDIPKYFKRIGRYNFTAQCEKVESEPVPKINRLSESGFISNYFTREIFNKINELVDTVNKMNKR